MRQIDAWSRCDRQEMSTDAPSAHATAALIGDTCDTTTTRLVPCPLGEVLARRADTEVELGQRLAALGDEGRVVAPPPPHLRRRVGVRHALVHPVRELDPPLVDGVVVAEHRRRLGRTQQRTADQLVVAPDQGGDRRRLLAPDLVERLVDAALQLAGGVERGAAVAHEDQHAGASTRLSPPHHRAATRRRPGRGVPGARTRRRRERSPSRARRQIHTLSATPIASNRTTSRRAPPTATPRRRDRSHRTATRTRRVSVHAPSNTRCSNVPIGSPSRSRRTGLRPAVASITTASSSTLKSTVCSTPAPPNSAVEVGQHAPTISSR